MISEGILTKRRVVLAKYPPKRVNTPKGEYVGHTALNLPLPCVALFTMILLIMILVQNFGKTLLIITSYS